MTDVGWRSVLRDDSSAAALRAYADWLEGQGMSGASLGSRMLALAGLVEADGWWRMRVDRLPRRVRDMLPLYRGLLNTPPSVAEGRGVWLASHRCGLEAVMTDVALMVLNHRVDLAALVLEAEGRWAG